jgi:hypothetical protein
MIAPTPESSKRGCGASIGRIVPAGNRPSIDSSSPACIGSLTLNWTVEHTLSESVVSFVYIRPKCFDSFQNLAGILGS